MKASFLKAEATCLTQLALDLGQPLAEAGNLNYCYACCTTSKKELTFVTAFMIGGQNGIRYKYGPSGKITGLYQCVTGLTPEEEEKNLDRLYQRELKGSDRYLCIYLENGLCTLHGSPKREKLSKENCYYGESLGILLSQGLLSREELMRLSLIERANIIDERMRRFEDYYEFRRDYETAKSICAHPTVILERIKLINKNYQMGIF